VSGKLPLIEDTFTEVAGAIRSAVGAAESRLHSTLGARLRELEARVLAAEMRRAAVEGALVTSEGEAARVTNLYVALTHLHRGLDPSHVRAAIGDVVTNLIGAEEFVLLVREDPLTGCEVAMARGVGPSDPHYGRGAYAGGDEEVDAALCDGLPRFGGGERVAIVPLLVGDETLGAIVILRLFDHKPVLFEEDREILALLGAHAGIALGATRAFVSDERNRPTAPAPRGTAR
jgi:hypothetical protein